MTEKPRVLLIGYGPTALSALRSLVRACRVEGLIRAAGDTEADPVLALAAAERIPSFPARRSNEIAAALESLRPDVVVISSYDRILQRDLLARGRFINVHYAPLPRYRGRATVNWMLINGEPNVSISIHFIDGGLDSGNILYQEHVPIGDRDTATSLYDALNAIQERELGPAVLRAVAGDGGLAQDGRSATYACTRLPSDGEIDWASPTAAIDRLVRALADPFPAAFTFFQGRRLLVRRAIPAPNSPSYEGRVPGRVAGLSRRDGWVDILTGDGVLRLLEVGFAGHPVCAPADLITSTRVTLGLSRPELLDRIEILEARLAALESRMAEGPNDAVPLTSASL